MKILLTLLCISTTLFGVNLPPSCSDDNCNMYNCGVDLSLEFLYLQPYFSKSLAISNSFTPYPSYEFAEIQDLNYPCQWEPSFRITMGYDDVCNCFGTQLSYHYLSQNTNVELNAISDIMSLPALSAIGVLGPVGVIQGKTSREFTLHDFELLFYHTHYLSCSHLFAPFCAIQGLVLNQKYTARRFIESTLNGSSIEQSAQQWGLGLKIGTNYTCKALDCLDLYLRGSYSILAGEVNPKLDGVASIINDTKINFLKDSYCSFIQEFHIGIGLEYQANLCCCPLAFSVGYEFTRWLNMWYVSERVGTANNQVDFGYHGVNLGISFCF